MAAGESELGAVRIGDYEFRFIDQPGGWLGDETKPDVPYITNLRLDPFERTGWPNCGTRGHSNTSIGSSTSSGASCSSSRKC